MTINEAELDRLEGLYAAALLDENDDYAGKEPDRIEFLFALCKAWPALITAARALPAEIRAREEAERELAEESREHLDTVEKLCAATTRATTAEPRVKALEEALAFGIGCALNELADRGLPLEWSPRSGIGRMTAALGLEGECSEIVAAIRARSTLEKSND